MILITLVLYIIVALLVRHTAQIRIGLCERHRAQRRRAIAVGWLLTLTGIGLIFLGMNSPYSGAALGFGSTLILVGLIYGLLQSQVVSAKKIDQHFV